MSTLTVGAGQQFQTIAAAIAAAQDGDVVAVQAGTYVNDFAEISHKITLEGVGGMVNMVATEPIPNGKAILITDTDVSIDHFSFSGAAVTDQNGAGIRYQGGNLLIANSLFQDDQDGILGAPDPAGTITIENSEFDHNGAGDGYTHGLYIGDIAALTIEDSYFHDAVVGHEIKSRAETTIIQDSRIEDGPQGTASYAIDLPNGGNVLISGSVVEKGPNSQNTTMIAFGEEGNLHVGSSLTVTGDTLLYDAAVSSSSTLVRNASAAPAIVTGDSYFGIPSAQILSGPGTVGSNTALASEPALTTATPIDAPAPDAPAAGAPASDDPDSGSEPASDGAVSAVFRFFDGQTGTQFLTTSLAERAAVLSTRPDLISEGTAFGAVSPADASAAPVFRFFDMASGTHFYTSSTAERDQAEATRADLNYEGVAFGEYAAAQPGTEPVYRFFDSTAGTHFYTASAGEQAAILATRPDLIPEGIAFYAPVAN